LEGTPPPLLSISPDTENLFISRAPLFENNLHNEELHNLYSSTNNQNDQVKEDEMGRACSTNGGEEKCIYDRLLVEKPEGKRPLGRRRRGWGILKWILER
jgi:hypothetical protein